MVKKIVSDKFRSKTYSFPPSDIACPSKILTMTFFHYHIHWSMPQFPYHPNHRTFTFTLWMPSKCWYFKSSLGKRQTPTSSLPEGNIIVIWTGHVPGSALKHKMPWHHIAQTCMCRLSNPTVQYHTNPARSAGSKLLLSKVVNQVSIPTI
jgi:hypothetical protein